VGAVSCEVEVTARFGSHFLLALWMRRPVHCRRGDMCADHGAQRQEKLHSREPVILVGQIEVAVQDDIGKIREPAMLEIHQ
jgi:hypothetical protein